MRSKEMISISDDLLKTSTRHGSILKRVMLRYRRRRLIHEKARDGKGEHSPEGVSVKRRLSLFDVVAVVSQVWNG